MSSINLSPAESMFLLNFKYTGSELMKITFMDLIFKKVLSIHQEDIKANDGDYEYFLKNETVISALKDFIPN